MPQAVRKKLSGSSRALAILAMTEAGERFSYYGMSAILVLYLDQLLQDPVRTAEVGGLTGLKQLLGSETSLGLASQMFGYYTALIYLFPLVGGWLADRGLGRRRAVTIGALLMCAGHFALASPGFLLVGLGLLVCGSGLLKGNITLQVGALYARDDAEGRARGFSVFTMGINAGAMVGPLAIGALAARFGWHAGFAMAGCAMALSTCLYVGGFRVLRESDNRFGITGDANRGGKQGFDAPRLSDGRDWVRVVQIGVAICTTIFPLCAYYQSFNLGLVWIDRTADLNVFGFLVPAAWFNTVDAASSIVCVPLVLAFWRWRERRWPGQSEIGKIADGAWLTALANLFALWGASYGDAVPIAFPLIYKALLGLAFLYYWPPLLALVSRLAPASSAATIMGATFLSLVAANALVGTLGSAYEALGAVLFFALHASIAGAGAILAMGAHRLLFRARPGAAAVPLQ